MSQISTFSLPDAPPRDLPLLAGLNTEQLAAVTLPPEHALILAGAGSGKTRVLITRIAWLLQTGQVSPGGVLAVTFTNKAAREMLTRLTAMLPLNVRGMWIGTFHGLCNRFLRAHHKLAALPPAFQILDTQDQLAAIKRLVKQHGIDEEQFPPRQLQWFIAGCKEDGQRPASVPVRDAESRKKVEIYQLYEDQCQGEGVVDFGELMLRSYELLRDHEAVRMHYRRRFRHLLIDEFQDTNRLQYAWIKIIAGLPAEGGGGAIMAVGDDDQSIYAFRGARVSNMADFAHEFHVARQIKLEQNYRSHSNILDTANALIAHNKRRLGKNLRTEAGAGEPVRVLEAPTDLAEARWLVDEVRHLVKEQGLPRGQIAVLYRSNAQSRVLETELFNAGVPYRVYGGLRFFERAEIKHALAYLRLLENPREDTSFLRVLNFPPRGIGARTIEQLQDAAHAAHLPLHDAAASVPGRAGAHLAGFIAKIDVLREQTAGLPLREIIEAVVQGSGLQEHYRNERDGGERLENLAELASAAESFMAAEAAALAPDPETGEAASPLAAFLAHAALEAGDHQAQAGQDAVQLMTVHASKGLEFDAVFITGLEEGLFPHENALSDHDGLEEERRLMYVAITRARQRLYLSHAQTRMLHGRTRYNVRSRFLQELPDEALKWLTPKRPVFSSMEDIPDFAASHPDRTWAKGQFHSKHASPGIPAASPAPAAGGGGLRPGQQVFHVKFGEGTVLALAGSGEDARAQVNFPRHGVKWLVLAIARLQIID
ncbi:MAG: UvrD-helicase domain-containing protein [Burkholderiaceae bacterium]|nr:UvrD-helicase domain-containing protein [Burkholderiaceae bacterium]